MFLQKIINKIPAKYRLKLAGRLTDLPYSNFVSRLVDRLINF